MISRRVQMLDSSGIRKVFDLGQKMKNPINLSIGQPDFDVPAPVKEAAKRAIDEGRSKYTLTQGIPELREGLMARARQSGYSPEEVIVTAGVSDAILLSMLALCDPGDEVLVPDPYFVIYRQLPAIVGVTARCFDTYPDFRLREENIAPLITPRTRAIVIVSPSNPTGVAATEDELAMIAALARKHDLTVIFDEIYSCFAYDRPHASITRHYDRVVVLNGFSKSHGMPGWRLGYAMGPKAIIAEMIKLQQYMAVCAPSLVQYAGLAALQTPMDATTAAYRRKRDIIYEGLKDRYEVVRPDGAFYIFPKAPGGTTGTQFFERAVERNVLVIPGGVFSDRDTHFRISFAAPDDTLRQGIEILNHLAQS